MRLRKRLFDAWASLQGRPSRETLAVQEEMAALKGRFEAINLELDDARRVLITLRDRFADMDVDRSNDDALVSVLEKVAGPLSQLKKQAALMDSGREVTGRSVMALARQVSAAVEAMGLQPIGSTGSRMSFDAALVEPIAAGTSIEPGEQVEVVFIGYRYRGRIIRKAMAQRPGA